MTRLSREAEKVADLLRECPFCGFDGCEMRVIHGLDGWRDRYYVLCDYDLGGCGAAGGERHSEGEAAACWNERVGKDDGRDE